MDPLVGYPSGFAGIYFIHFVPSPATSDVAQVIIDIDYLQLSLLPVVILCNIHITYEPLQDFKYPSSLHTYMLHTPKPMYTHQASI